MLPYIHVLCCHEYIYAYGGGKHAYVFMCVKVDVRWFLKFFSIFSVEPGSLSKHEAHCTVWLGWLWSCEDALGSSPSSTLYGVAGLAGPEL